VSPAVSLLQTFGTASPQNSCYDIADVYQRLDRSVLVRESGCFAVTDSRYIALLTSCYDIADVYQRWDRSVLVLESGYFAVYRLSVQCPR
jgi:hypothetical protein